MLRKLLVGALALVAAGCLQKDTTHSIYLSPDGTAKWVATEQAVASDEQEAAARLAEEQRYITAAAVGSHPAALALKALGPDTLVETTIVRDERPFHVVTKAGYTRADRMLERLFVENGIPASATTTSDGVRTTLRVQLDFTRGMVERDTPAHVLLDELEQLTFVVTEGQFIGGGGIDVMSRGGAAKLSSEWLEAVDAAARERRTVELVIAWE
jgi:hypothetical protein